MANETIIARRYAKGLAELANQLGLVHETREDIRIAMHALDPHRGEAQTQLHDFLTSPVVLLENKLEVVQSILAEMAVGEATVNCICLLLEKNRLDLLPAISRSYAEIAASLSGEYTAVVRTARPLTPEQAERLTQALSSAFDCTVRLHQQIEPALLAGARVTVGDKTFDGSVLGRLEQLRRRLVASAKTGMASQTETE